MAYVQNENQRSLIFDPADDPVITDPVFPEFSQPRALQNSADDPCVVEFRNSVAKKLEDSMGDLSIKLV